MQLFKKLPDLVLLLSVSDSNGYVIDENGIDFDLHADVKEKCARLTESMQLRKAAAHHTMKVLCGLTRASGIALPCAFQNVINEAAKRLVALICVSKALALLPSDLDAIKVYKKRNPLRTCQSCQRWWCSCIFALEMSKSSLRLSWTREEV